MKKAVIVTIFIALSFLAVNPLFASYYELDDPVVSGLNYATIAGYAGYGTQDIRDAIGRIIRIILGFTGLIAIVIILWGGFRWMTAGGSEEKVKTAKGILTAGAIGLFLVFAAYAIATFVINVLARVTAGPP
jgi:TRAP-type C4-dicarboxylate transport system permease small subunit